MRKAKFELGFHAGQACGFKLTNPVAPYMFVLLQHKHIYINKHEEKRVENNKN